MRDTIDLAGWIVIAFSLAISALVIVWIVVEEVERRRRR